MSACIPRTRWVAWSIAAMLFTQPAAAQAEDPSPDAHALFVEGRALLEQGRFAEACQRFEQSDQLVSTIATLFNLGYCLRRLDEPLRALDYYQRAEAAALAEHDSERAEASSAEAASIVAQLARLTWLVFDRSQEDVHVLLDDIEQPKGRWGSPVLVRPGEHVLMTQRAGATLWSEQVTLTAGEQRIVMVPQTSDVAPSKQAMPVSDRNNIAKDAVDTGLGTQRWLAISLAGVGVVGLGLATTFGILASNASSEAAPMCGASCTNEANALRERAFAHATRADISLIAGVVALSGAAVLWLTAPSSSSSTRRARVAYQPGGAQLGLALEL